MLTLGRILVIPLFVCFTYDGDPCSSLLAASLFTLAAVTDVVDGFLARRWNMITVVGKLLDPLADKLIVAAALVMMVAAGADSGVGGDRAAVAGVHRHRAAADGGQRGHGHRRRARRASGRRRCSWWASWRCACTTRTRCPVLVWLVRGELQRRSGRSSSTCRRPSASGARRCTSARSSRCCPSGGPTQRSGVKTRLTRRQGRGYTARRF